MNDSSRTNSSGQSLDAEARKILGELTLEEKIGMLSGSAPFWSGFVDLTGGGYCKHTWNAAELPRFGLPGLRFTDGPRGIILSGATTFPAAMARGAAWDAALEERVGEAIGKELRALGGNLFGGVCINLLRHPAWGRAQETYGEDPVHVGELGAAMVRGVQRHALACAKHFAFNSIENARCKVDVKAGPRALREIYTRHFHRVVQEDVAAVMSSYNSFNGEWCGQNRELLTDLLKDEWGFRGFVLSDFVFGMRDAKKAILAGQNLEMPFRLHFDRDLKGLVERGEVPVERIDDAVVRILRQQLRLRTLPAPDKSAAGCAQHRALAREVAAKSIVLLKNDGLLPLGKIAKLAVIGRLADTPNTGDGGSSNTQPAYVITPLAGLREALGAEAEVVYDDGSDIQRAAGIARGADAVVVVAGFTHQDEGEFIDNDLSPVFSMLRPPPVPAGYEGALDSVKASAGFARGGDRRSLTLRAEDEKLIRAVAAANPRSIVAIMAGSAVIVESWKNDAAAILMLWYPGMEGGRALADVLLGNVNPSGRLPFAAPRSAEDLPVFDSEAEEIEYDLWHGYRKFDRDRVAPAFPFGFGLSYTSFEYRRLQLDRTEVAPTGTLSVLVDVANTGPRDGDEVVQIYVRAPGSSVERPARELKAFGRVSVPAGQVRTCTMKLPVESLAYYDVQTARMTVEPIQYELLAARHSLDPAPLVARFAVTRDAGESA
jgi:beta-glucosidase